MIKKTTDLIRTVSANKNRIDGIEEKLLQLSLLAKENYWCNVFNSAITGSVWFKDIPLNVGRWAANYSLLYVLFRILNEVKPTNVLEMGLGETTRMIQAYKQFHNTQAYCGTIEQSNEWIDIKLNTGIAKEFIDIIHADVEEIVVKGHKTLAYKDLPASLEVKNKKYNLIVVDGPWGSDRYSRYNVLELLQKGLVHEDFIIIMDDCHRVGEKETNAAIIACLTENKIGFETGIYEGDKTQFVITASKYKYLTSL